MITKQMQAWSGQFGQDYTNRNCVSVDEYDASHAADFGVTRTELNAEFLRASPTHGTHSGDWYQRRQPAALLQRIGFTELYGVELQWGAVELARSRVSRANIVQGSAFDVPFREGWFDVVFTSNVLIHFHPTDVVKVMAEMWRCSKQFIWGSEYLAPEFTEVEYRGHQNLFVEGRLLQALSRVLPAVERRA